MNTPYYLTATSRAALAARSAEIRAHLKQRREVRQYPASRALYAGLVRMFSTPFMIGDVRL